MQQSSCMVYTSLIRDMSVLVAPVVMLLGPNPDSESIRETVVLSAGFITDSKPVHSPFSERSN